MIQAKWVYEWVHVHVHILRCAYINVHRAIDSTCICIYCYIMETSLCVVFSRVFFCSTMFGLWSTTLTGSMTSFCAWTDSIVCYQDTLSI